MAPVVGEQVILQEALDVLENTTALNAKILPMPKDQRLRPDAIVEIQRKGRTERFLVEVKHIDRHIALGQVKAQLMAFIDAHYPGYHPLLVTKFLTLEIIDECHKLDLPFIDTAGNMYIHTDLFLADIRGRARPENPLKHEYRANNPAGLKIVFALLCKPDLVDAPYREIAKFARVALGAIGPVLKDLTQRAYLQERRAKRIFTQKKKLLDEWVAFYPANLRPTLDARRHQADRTRLTETDLGRYGAYWGGEYGAEKLTRYLKAERFTIYVPGAPPPALMLNTRMRLATDGNTEILRTFWHPDLVKQQGNVAPPLLVYADLVATAEPRNLETAREVDERFLKTAENQ
ncbi:MAG: type IV toxin-antitoxin system AbiEi family antitoxin [Silvibacterium sp.]